MIRIAVTTGDPDGIGLEVSCKALGVLGPQKNVQFFMYRSAVQSGPLTRLLLKKWKIVSCANLRDALDAADDFDHRTLFEISNSDKSAPEWVAESARACLKKQLQGICTAPLSKTLIRDSGFKDRGHTEIFKRICKVKDVNMAFLGQKFNVVLATDHIPLKQVSRFFTAARLRSTIQNALWLRSILPANLKKLPLAVLGPNPHGGEEGLLGSEEGRLQRVLTTEIKQGQVKAWLPPDVAFQKNNWAKYSMYIAAYHDQGLIPFKMVHGQDSGVHISLGLPFIRTSVDHGTAKDIFGLNRANPQSMIEALEWSVRLIRLKQKEN